MIMTFYNRNLSGVERTRIFMVALYYASISSSTPSELKNIWNSVRYVVNMVDAKKELVIIDGLGLSDQVSMQY